MKNKIIILILIPIFFFSSLLSVSANSNHYYHKGIVYGSTASTPSSAVVLAASAVNYSGTQKEHVVVYSRCDVMKGAYNASLCIPRTVKTTLYASTSGGNLNTSESNILGWIAPVEATNTTYLPDFGPLIKNYYLGGVYFLVNAMFNSYASAKSIEHYRNTSNTLATVTYTYPSPSILDVPNTIKYQDILGYYNNKPKGLSTNFQLSMVSGYLTAKANIVYELGRESYPFEIERFNVTTYEVKLPHSYGM